MKILVTGVLGTVGSILKQKLQAKGHEVFGIDLYHAPGEIGFTQQMSGESLDYCRCDIGDYRQLDRIFSQIGITFDLVYNCAAEFGRWNGEDYYEQLWSSNAIGLRNLLTLQKQYRFKLVHFSSSEVYGDYTGVMQEDVMDTYEIKQLNDYAISKWANEMQIANAKALYGNEVVILRLFNTYGPGEYYHPYRSVNCKFCYHALKGLPINVYTNHFRSSTYIDDAVTAISNIADNFIDGRVYNIGSNEYHDIETLANIIWEYTGADRDLITYKESEILTTKTKTPDITRSVNELNYKSTVSLKDGVQQTIEWMRQNDPAI